MSSSIIPQCSARPLSAGRRARMWLPRPDPSRLSLGWEGSPAGPSPDSLVLQPASIALLVACLIGGLQLLRRGDDRSGAQAGLPRLLVGQRVAGRARAVVEHDSWRGGEEREGDTR